MSKAGDKNDIVLVDTDVFSYLGRPGSRQAALYLPHVDQKRMALSFITVGELYFGAVKAKWAPDRIASLNDRLRSVLIVPYDLAVCQSYADIKARLELDGNCIADNDLWIAGCALRHSIPLVSNNRSHFERVPGLHLISEAKVLAEIRSQLSLDEVPDQSDGQNQSRLSDSLLRSHQSAAPGQAKTPR